MSEELASVDRLEAPVSAPIALDVNPIPRFYAGGARIAAFRDVDPASVSGPEDWIGSTTPVWSDELQGLSRLRDGRLLRDLVRTEPEAMLGAAHVARFGGDPALLVKLLDAGERLAVHCHPDDRFAGQHLGVRFGKNEAWMILETAGEGTVHAGFKEPVDPATLRRWVEQQDVAAMLGALNQLTVARGDALFMPAGVPHAIGAGILLLELQQPTDLSIMLEWPGPSTDEDPFLGLDAEVALAAVDRTAVHPAQLRGARAARDPGARPLLPGAADPFFRAEHIVAAGELVLDQGFSILVVLEGDGELEGAGGSVALHPGATVLIPHAAGAACVVGGVRAINCRPPEARVA